MHIVCDNDNYNKRLILSRNELKSNLQTLILLILRYYHLLSKNE